MKKTQCQLAMVLVAASFLVWASTGGAAQHVSYTDAQIQSMIEHDLGKESIESLAVEVHDGVVTLRGKVRSAWEKEKAIEAATAVHDVAEVRSDISIGGGESDEQLAAEVGNAIERYVFYTIFDGVGATVADGVVTLNGYVTMPYKSTELGRYVSRVTGVKEVRNEIEVLPNSPTDDELRSRLAAEIYRDRPELANRAHPPIHVVVERGRVILLGAVRSNADRVQIEHLVRSQFGVFAVDNRLRVG